MAEFFHLFLVFIIIIQFPRHANLVDGRGEHGVRADGGRLRERSSALLQETSSAAQRSHFAPARRTCLAAASEDHDHLHHRRTRQRRCVQNDPPEGQFYYGISKF